MITATTQNLNTLLLCLHFTLIFKKNEKEEVFSLLHKYTHAYKALSLSQQKHIQTYYDAHTHTMNISRCRALVVRVKERKLRTVVFHL